MFTLVAHFTRFMQYRRIFVYMMIAGWLSACSKPDTEAPLLEPYVDADSHYRGTPYTAPDYWVADNHTCNINEQVVITSTVDENRYGTYTTTYSATDDYSQWNITKYWFFGGYLRNELFALGSSWASTGTYAGTNVIFRSILENGGGFPYATAEKTVQIRYDY